MAGMSETVPPRPRQITMAVAMSVVGSLLLVVSLFDTLGRLRTPDTRESIDELLAGLPGGAGKLETAQVVDALRALTFASGALAAMLLVFAVFVLQRHRGARIGFTVVAALLLVTIPVAGLMPVLLAVAAGLIWSRPGRDWYAGRTPAPARTPPPRAVEQSAVPPTSAPEAPTPSALSEDGPPPSPYPFGTPPGAEPPPSGQQPAPPSGPQPAPPSGQQPAQPAPQPAPPPGQPYGQPAQPYGQPAQPYGHYPPPSQPPVPRGSGDPDKRPFSVTLAAILTWLGAGLVSAAMGLFAVVLASGGQLFVDEFDKAAQGSDLNLSREEVLAVGWGVTLFFLVWSLIAMVLAGLAFRRSNAARIALSVSAVVAALLSLLLILSIVSSVTLLMAGAAAVLLFTGGANEWYSRRAKHTGGPGSGYPGDPYGSYPGYYPPGYGSQPPTQPPTQPQQAPQPSPPPGPPEGRPKPW
jgi:MFS family permease